MSRVPRPARLRRLGAALALGLVAAGGLVACGSGDDDGATAGADSDTWPRTFTNADGTTTEIEAKPERILSTAVSVTGTLLSFDAPVVASSAGGDGEYLDQWADVADERGVEKLWSAGSVDLEMVYGADPDLIVVATSGRDSLADQVDQLAEIAPTIVVDYGDQTWEELAAELGEATGLEDEVTATVADFDAYVADAASEITVPEGEANIISFNGAGEDNPVGRAGGPHGQLLAALGFTVEDPDPSWHTQAQERADFVWAPFENLAELTAGTTFVLSVDDAGAQLLRDDPVLANLPSVQADRVFGLGVNSFRIDPYSATEIVDGIVAELGA